MRLQRLFSAERRHETFAHGLSGEDSIAARARSLATHLLEPAEGVRSLQVRLSRLQAPTSQAPLFPVLRPAR